MWQTWGVFKFDYCSEVSIGKCAVENGVTATIRYYAKAFPNLPLKETTVRRLKNNYQVSLKTGQGSSKDFHELPGKSKVGP